MTNVQENNARLAYMILERKLKNGKMLNNGKFKIIFDNINKSEHFTNKLLVNKWMLNRISIKNHEYMINMINGEYLSKFLKYIFEIRTKSVIDALFSSHLKYKPERWDIIVSFYTMRKLEGNI